MTERLRSASAVGYHIPKMENEHDLSPRKTMVVVVIVVGCFAVLWPKVFYPMLVGSAEHHIKPSPIDKNTGCCDVISEIDVNTIKIMNELCGTIIKGKEDKALTGREVVQRCQQEILETCGIDISAVLQEQVRLGQNVKLILDEIRSLNGSLCLKYNYGLAPWRLGVPHRITLKSSDTLNIRQERPVQLRAELIHPAFRERGRAIPQPQAAPPSRPPPRIVEGRPGPIPGMRPTIGGAGHVVPPSKQATSSMSIIMPIYTVGIVVFFTYTLMKIIFKKHPENIGSALYPPVDPDPQFRKEVFESSESSRLGSRIARENLNSKLVVNAMSALLDEVDQEIEARRKSSEVASQDLVNGSLSNGAAVKPQEEEQPTVKVLGMEMTASCEGGKKWSRPDSPVLPVSPAPPVVEPSPPPQEIYLERALPAQSHLLVADSAIESESASGDPAVVLSGKMTLSVISLDSENEAEEAKIVKEDSGKTNKDPLEDSENKSAVEDTQVIELIKSKTALEEPTNSIQLDRLSELSDFNDEKLDQLLKSEETPRTTSIEKDIDDFLQSLKRQEFQAPSITVEGENDDNVLEVETLETEVDDLIQDAIQSIKERNEQSEFTNETNELQSENVAEVELKPSPLLPISNKVEASSPNLEDIRSEIDKILQEVQDLPLVAEDVDSNQVLGEKTEEVAIDTNQLEDANEKPELDKEVPQVEAKTKINDNLSKSESEEEELASDEEVEEIEEIVYEDESDVEEEEIEVEVEEESEDEVSSANRATSNSAQRVNGEQSSDFVEESKYTTVSGATAAENEISSDEEVTDEDVEEEEEIIEIEEEIEDEEYVNDENINHRDDETNHEH